MLKLVDAIALATVISPCAFQAASDPGAAKVNAPALDQFVDGKWVLRVDGAILIERLGLNRRSEDVDESEYGRISKGSTYPILVSDRGTRVDIDGDNSHRSSAAHPGSKTGLSR